MSANWEEQYEMPEEYDLDRVQWVPNPFRQSFRELNLVSLDADVQAAFPDSNAVNRALRSLLEEKSVSLKKAEAA